MDGTMDGSMDGTMAVTMDGSMDGTMDGAMDGRVMAGTPRAGTPKAGPQAGPPEAGAEQDSRRRARFLLLRLLQLLLLRPLLRPPPPYPPRWKTHPMRVYTATRQVGQGIKNSAGSRKGFVSRFGAVAPATIPKKGWSWTMTLIVTSTGVNANGVALKTPKVYAAVRPSLASPSIYARIVVTAIVSRNLYS